MRFAIVGSGAVGGYYGARLVRAGHDVTFIARGAHLAAMRGRGLTIRSPLGDFTVSVRAESNPAHVGPVDVAIFAVKAYSNPETLPLLEAVVRDEALALTLQNGVDSVAEVAAVVGNERTLGGATYIATVITEPGVISQTGTHRRIVFGEVFGDTSRVSDRVRRLGEVFAGADIESEPVADARGPIWEKFCYLSPFAAFTAAARLPIGPLWSDPDTRTLFLAAVAEVESVARAEGVPLPPGVPDRIADIATRIPPATRSSLLNDLESGRPLEVEALLGAVVRRGRQAGVATPIMATLYSVLKPHAEPQSH